MKAIVLDDKGSLHLKDIAVPIPKSNELLVKIRASGFNPIDYQMIENEHERKLMHSPILGREFSGIVTAIGAHVRQFKPGDAVFAGSGSMGTNGTYAEYIAIPEQIAALKPDVISFEEASAIPSAGLTALQCFDRMNLQKQHTLFMSEAAGGVGTMLIKLLIAKNFTNFIVSAGNQQSINALKSIGVTEDQIINYTTDDLKNVALSKNHNQGFDFVIDLVGNKIAETAAALVKINGTYLDVTALSTTISREILFNKGTVVINISNFAHSLNHNYSYYSNGLARLSDLLSDGSIKPPHIDIVGALNVNTIERAHQALRENNTKGKKLVMRISTHKPDEQCY